MTKHLWLMLFVCGACACADDLALRVGVGWSEESVAAFGQFTERQNPVAVLNVEYMHKRMLYGLDLSARFGAKAIRGRTGALVGDLKTFRGGWYGRYDLGCGYSLELRHFSDHSQGTPWTQGQFGDIYQRNLVVLWKELQ